MMNLDTTDDTPSTVSQRNMNPKILIVEDEKLVSWSLVKTLQKFNYTVIVVESGEMACDLLRSNQFDIVITDVNLPQIDGFAVAKCVKQKFPHVPVVMMSALAENSLRNGSSDSCIDRFIEKPFDIAEFIKIIQEILTAA